MSQTSTGMKKYLKSPDNYLNRNLLWINEFKSGSTMREIADKYGFTRGYVHIVLKNMGVSAKTGGHAIGGGETNKRTKKRKEKIEARREAVQERRAERERRTGMPTGVTLHKSSGLFRASAHSKILPGYHKSVEEALEARERALQILKSEHSGDRPRSGSKPSRDSQKSVVKGLRACISVRPGA